MLDPHAPPDTPGRSSPRRDSHDDIKIVDYASPATAVRNSVSSRSLRDSSAFSSGTDGEGSRSGRSTPVRFRQRSKESKAQKLMTKLKHRFKNAADKVNGKGSSPVPTTSTTATKDQTAFDSRIGPDAPVMNAEYLTNERPAIKVRIASFNMASYLPSRSGDLSDFLGQLDEVPPQRTKSAVSSATASTASVHKEQLPQYPLDSSHPYHILVVGGQECPTASGMLQGRVSRWNGKGWTYRLEKYLCGESSEEPSESDDEQDDENGSSTDDNASVKSYVAGGKKTRGPYVLVEKERLMGIYLAVFVRRECESFVTDCAKARVTAGLLKGRVGNKGACAVSLVFAGQRLLFVSAHLAAHASALEIRRNNVEKIWQELASLDDFSGDPSARSKHLTDRWDQVFFFGDLNFRLDISRLHADWLLKTKDYPTALEFDQLRKTLKDKDSPFPGFQEGPILFAPTYKYDLAPRPKRRTLRAIKRRSQNTKDTDVPSSPVSHVGSALSDPEVHENGGEALSLISSRDSSLSNLVNDDDDHHRGSQAQDLAAAGLPGPPLKGGETSMEAMRQAQVKLIKMIRSNSTSPLLPQRSLDTTAPELRRPLLRTAHTDLAVPQVKRPETPQSGDEEPAGKSLIQSVYDTSSKQRVQSYTDRILFKSTVEGGETSGPSPSQILAPALVDSIRHYRSGRGPAFVSPEQQQRQNELGQLSPSKPSPASEKDLSPKHAHFEAIQPKMAPRRVSADHVIHRDRIGTPKLRKQMKRTATSSSSSKGFRDAISPHAVDGPFWKRTASSPTPRTATSPAHGSPAGPSPNTSLAGDLDKVKSSPPIGMNGDAAAPIKRSRSESLASNSTSAHNVWRDMFRSTGPLSRSATRASSGNAATGPGLSLKGLRDLLSSIPNPFTGTLSRSRAASLSEAPVIDKTGPKKGEIPVIQYSSVTDIGRMGAISDHRPVYAVLAIGLGEPERLSTA